MGLQRFDSWSQATSIYSETRNGGTCSTHKGKGRALPLFTTRIIPVELKNAITCNGERPQKVISTGDRRSLIFVNRARNVFLCIGNCKFLKSTALVDWQYDFILKELVEHILEDDSIHSAETFLEIGPGSGAISLSLLNSLPHVCTWFAISVYKLTIFFIDWVANVLLTCLSYEIRSQRHIKTFPFCTKQSLFHQRVT